MRIFVTPEKAEYYFRQEEIQYPVLSKGRVLPIEKRPCTSTTFLLALLS